MFNSYYHAQTQCGQVPLASNNPFYQTPAPTNPFRQSVYLPQQVSHDSFPTPAGAPPYTYGQQSQSHRQPYGELLASRAISPDPRAASPSPSSAGHGLTSYASGPHLVMPQTAEMKPQGIMGTHFDPMASLAGQFGHMSVGVHERQATAGYSHHSLPPSQKPLLSTGMFEPVAAFHTTPGYLSLSRRTSCSSSTHSPSTTTPAPSSAPPPWTATTSPPWQGSPRSVPAGVGSPGLVPLRRGSPARSIRSIREAPVRYQPSMRESGQPGTLWMCPRDTVINYRTTWHVLRASGMTLTCCPPCYVAYAAGVSLGFAVEELEATRCMFHTKRAQALLIAGDAAGIPAYFQTRTRVKDCPGAAGCGATAGITWYRPRNGPGDSVCCEACFEDHARANVWASRFERVTHPPDVMWGCDFAMDSVRDGYIKLAPVHWDEWRRLVDRRSAAGFCTSSDVRAGSRKWYTITPAITGLVICEACYLDKVTTSRFAAHFVPHVVDNPNDVYMCDFSSLYFIFPFMVADETNAWGKFQTAASRVMDCAMAQMNGARQQFWGLGSGPRGRNSDWDVCEKCYASLFEPYGFDRYLQPRPPPDQPRGAARGARHCDMCPGAPRKTEMLAHLQEAAYAGVFSQFSDWARRAAGAQNKSRKAGVCYALGAEDRRAW